MAEDKVWETFARLMKGYTDSREEDIAKRWAEMAKMSSQKKLMLQKQNNLRSHMRAL